MNKVQLMGRLTRNPESKYVGGSGDTLMVKYTLAVDRRYRGSNSTASDFINCVVYGKGAEFAMKWLKKGMKIAVCGRIQTGSYTGMEYLVDQRKLDKDIVSEFIKRGDIYQEKDHQRVVFVGRDSGGNPRYASWRNAGVEQLRGDVSGSQKEYGFKSVAFWDEDKQRKRLARKLYVFESPIVLLSFLTLYPKYWHENHYLSLGGVSAKAFKTFLSERSDCQTAHFGRC